MNIILYLLNIIQYQYKIIGQLLTLSVNTFLSSSGLLTIHTLQSIKNSKSTNYQKSFPTSRIGIGRILLDTMNSDTTRQSNPCSVMANATFLKISAVSPVMFRSITSCGTMEKNRPRSYAKYANLVSSLMLKQIFKNACLEMPSLQPHARTYERPQTLRYT